VYGAPVPKQDWLSSFTRIILVDPFNSIGFANFHTLRIAKTEIAFDNDIFSRALENGAIRTSLHTLHAASTMFCVQ
jgi:hypothetical protein